MIKRSPFSLRVALQIKKLLEQKQVRVRANSTVIFVCGAKKEQNPNARSDFISYAISHIKDTHIFKAESVFKAFDESHDLDLLTIEEKLAHYSDCILIILESDGAKVELGAFSAHESVVEKMMIVNHPDFRTEQSFISMGPLAKIKKKSIFNTIYHARFESIYTVFPQIEEALKTIVKTNRRPLKIHSYEDLEKMHQHRLFFIADLIWIFSPLSHSTLIQVLKFLFGDTNSYNCVKIDIAFLRAMEWVSVQETGSGEHYYVHGKRGDESFCTFGMVDIGADLRAIALQHLHKNKIAGLSVLKEYAHGLS